MITFAEMLDRHQAEQLRGFLQCREEAERDAEYITLTHCGRAFERLVDCNDEYVCYGCGEIITASEGGAGSPEGARNDGDRRCSAGVAWDG